MSRFLRNYIPNRELDYKDVFIVPQYSEITSRREVDTSICLEQGLNLDVPIISANMSSVTEEDMCLSMHSGGGIGAMHRFMSIEDNVKKYSLVKQHKGECFVSLGINEESKERAKALYEAGARYFCIDIAHGHSLNMKNMISWLRQTFGNDLIIMAGNVATYNATKSLHDWGANIIKVGIGPGSVCLTKNQTAVTYPQFSAVMDCALYANQKNVPIVADGGLTEYGDVCRALAAGASAVMSGKFFAGCKDAPGDVSMVGNKSYYGMASKKAMKLIKREEDMATPEGKEITIQATTQSARDIVKELKGAIQSSLSYSNSRNLQEFRENAIFGIR